MNSYGHLHEARAVNTDWNTDDKRHQKHSSLGYRTPTEYAEQCTCKHNLRTLKWHGPSHGSFQKYGWWLNKMIALRDGFNHLEFGVNSLASGFDDNYVWPWLVHAFSGNQSSELRPKRLLAWTGDNLSIKNKNLIENVTEWLEIPIQWIPISVSNRVHTDIHISAMSYARLALADTLEKTFIWLDADTLLLPNWDSLLTFPPLSRGSIVRASIDNANDLGALSRNQARIRAGVSYFNSGVMQINPAEWRNQGLNIEWLKLVDKYEEYNFELYDQCILNFLLAGENVELSTQYNLQRPFQDPDLPDPFVIHYSSEIKPWKVSHLERTRIFCSLSSTSHYWFSKYWEVEKTFISQASFHSESIADELRALQIKSRGTHIQAVRRGLSGFRRKLGHL